MRALITFTSKKVRYDELIETFKTQLNLLDTTIELDQVQGLENVEIYSLDSGKPELRINGIDIKEYGLVLNYKTSDNFDISSLIAHYCVNNGIKVINEVDYHYYRAGKITQKVVLSSNDIKTPKYYFHSNAKTYSYERLLAFFGDKFVAKQADANLGKKVVLIESKEDWDNLVPVLEHHIDDHGLWFFEEFIDHDYSIRGFVTGDDCSVAIKVSTEKDSFKTNHGEAVFYKNEDALFTEVCVKAAKLNKLQISGVDTIQTKSGEIYVLEVNKSPGITIDKGHSLEADAILNLITRKLYDRE